MTVAAFPTQVNTFPEVSRALQLIARMLGAVSPASPIAAAKFIIQQPYAGLTNAQALSVLATGLLKSTTGTGILSIVVAGDLPAHASRHNTGGDDPITDLAGTVLTSGLIPAARIQEVIALADLSDVTAKTGTGTVAVMQTSPTIVTPTIQIILVPSGGMAFRTTAGGTNIALIRDGGLGYYVELRSTAAGTKQAIVAANGVNANLNLVTPAGTGVVMANSVEVVVLSGAQSLSDKTLVLPIIADFTNAQHDHEDAAGGGTLVAAAISDFSTAVLAIAQALDATLTALAALDATAGILVQTGADTFTKRTLTGSTSITVADGDGVSGPPTVSRPALTGDVTAPANSNTTTIAALAVTAAKISSGAATDGQVLTADGAGNAAWEAAAGGVTDHGALTGLADDDHTQYMLAEPSATDNALVRWDLTTGRAVQNSGATLDDSNNMLFPTTAATRYRNTNSTINSPADGEMDLVWTVMGRIGAAGDGILGTATESTFYSHTDGNTHLGKAGNALGDVYSIGTVTCADLDANTAIVQPGSAAASAKVGGSLTVNTTSVGNVGTGEDDLMTYSVPASTLGTDGQSVWFEASGTIANNANAKRIRVKFGATTILDTGAIPTSAAIDWVLRGRVVRTGAATQKCYVSLNTNNGTLLSPADYTTAAETLSGAVTLKLTGEAVSNNDIVHETMIVGYDHN